MSTCMSAGCEPCLQLSLHPSVRQDLLRCQRFAKPEKLRECSDEKQVAALLEEAVQRFGRLDTMVNNAGRMQQNNHLPFEEISIDDFDATYRLNVRGTLLGMKHAARYSVCNSLALCSPFRLRVM